MIRKEGSQNKLQVEKIPDGQEYAPRLEPTAPIHLAKRQLNDGLPAHAIQSTRESYENVFTYSRRTSLLGAL